MKPNSLPPHPPPWWPPEQSWPPAAPIAQETRAWHHARVRFMRRLAFLMTLLLAVACGGFALLTWLAVDWTGAFRLPHPVRPTTGPAFFVGLVVVVVGLLVAGRALRRVALPIGDLMEAAGRVAEGDYSARVAETGSREVRELVRAFNAMAAQLQAQDAARRNLLADVTHELRTPLTVIQGNLEGLLDGVYPRDEEHLQPVLDETRILSRLIDDLRTLALAESGALKLEKEPIDLATLVEDALAAYRPQAETAGVELSAEVPADLTLQIDPARIRQVLANLIANALRYTAQGGRVRVGCTAGERVVTISVSDTGTGIPPEDVPHLFDRFHKSRDSRGTGLGLAIAKNLVAAHGGEISAQSQPGQGTTIRFTLPRE